MRLPEYYNFQWLRMGPEPTDERVPLSITVEAKSKVAVIAITGYISEYSKNNSGQVIKDIADAKDKGIKEAEIYINSQGGSVFEANEILNLIDDNFDKITVKVGALAASAATIFPAKYPTTVKANSQIMIHKPMMGVGGNEDEIEARLKLLKNLTSQYRKMYAKKMGITEKALEALWKTDFWMTADEAKKRGFVDTVEGSDEKIDANTRLQLVACGAPNIPNPNSGKQQISNKNKIPRMELSVLAVQLGLPSTATQEQVDAKIKELNEKAAKVEALQNAADNKEKAEKAEKIKAILDKAETEKKIDATMRSNYEAIGENNLEQLEAILENAKPIEAVSGQLNKKNDGGATASGKDRSGWTYKDYQEKDPEALIEMNEKEPEKFEALYKEFYKED
ncbi:Clp protease ClpP [Flagellimonas eckloniae]|nr:ATP-dependent Clp protease proteolytic subunit [Allomuricauda eckloniae]